MGTTHALDRVSRETLGAVLAGTEARAIKPPPDLTGDARELFVRLAEGNKSRPWNQSHADALADYARVCVLWSREWAAIETEGATVGGKRNARFLALGALSTERGKLAKLLGITVGASDKFVAGHNGTEKKMRTLGAAIAASGEKYGGLLA